MKSFRHGVRAVLSALLAVCLLLGTVPAALAAQTGEAAELAGEGTEESPFLISSESDYILFANLLNAGEERYAGQKFFSITNDLYFSGQPPMIQSFEGTLDGTGHTILGLSLRGTIPSSNFASYKLALIGQNTGVIKNLAVDAPSVIVTGGTGASGPLVGVFAALSTGGVFENCAIIGGSLQAPKADKVAGFAASNENSTVTDCYFTGTVNAALQPAAIFGYSKGTESKVERCYIEAELTTSKYGGPVCAYPNRIQVNSTVVADGKLTVTREQPENYNGRLIGTYDKFDSNSFENNYVNQAFTINGQPAAGGADVNGKLGGDISAEALSSQSVYEGLGWDFQSVWKWDDSLGHPALRYVDVAHRPDRITVTFNGDAMTRKGFTWYTEGAAEEPVVRVSKQKDFEETLEFVPTVTQTANGCMYKALAENLEPDSAYYYQVGDKKSGIFSAVGSFVTAAADGAFSFINLTDTQAKSSSEAQTSASAIAKALQTVDDAAFLLHGGDFVQTGDDESMWKDMLNLSRSSMLRTTLAPAAGNHEAEPDAFISHFNLEAPNGQDVSTGAYYSFDYSTTHFAVLNTNEDAEQGISQAQLDWLRQDVTAARAKGADWVILSLHKGPYTTANHLADADIKALRRVLVPLVDELDIDLVLQGHDHVLARTKSLKYAADGVECAVAAETSQFTEIRNGKRIDYQMNPDGTVYLLMNTAGAKHYQQNENPDGVDMDKYLALFDRSDQENTSQYFAGITVTETGLTAMIYQIRSNGEALAVEGFGFDREVQPVIDQIDGLPTAETVAASDAQRVRSAYEAYAGLRDAQRAAVSNSDKLFALLRRLHEMGQVDGNLLQWNDPSAVARQSVAVRNDTGKSFQNAPVLLRLENIPADTAQDTLKLYDMEGLALPYEVENWNPEGVTTVWVKVPELPAGGAANLWVYYGGETARNNPARVWNDDYQLVEHFAADTEDGGERVDSTGKQTGLVVGGVTSAEGEDGARSAYLENSKITYGNLGAGYDAISVSAVFSATEEDLAKMAGSDAAILSKDLLAANPSNSDAFFLGLTAAQTALARYSGVWIDNGDLGSWESADQPLPADGRRHLLTMSYDGMTVVLYIDGKQVFDAFAENRTTLSDVYLPTTIGAYSDGGVVNPFCGTLDEVQLTGAQVSAEWEAFRYRNYFGDAVLYGEVQRRSEEKLALTIAQPSAGTSLENGWITLSGVINKPATLTAQINGQEIALGEVEMGAYAVQAPVNGIGAQTLTLRAVSKADAADTAETSVDLLLTDTQAPRHPILSDSSFAGGVQGDKVTLTAKADADDREKLTARFYQNALVDLNEDNTVLYEGTTADALPDALRPGDGVRREGLTGVTAGADLNPYQIYEITLTPEQAAASQFHLVWKGSTERLITTYVFDNSRDGWVETGSAYDKETGRGTIEMTIANENVVKDGKLYLLIWRGMNQAVESRADFRPTAGEYDFTFQILPDTQLYAQSYPDRVLTQFQWMADQFDDVKGRMVLSVGDVVNRPYLTHEYQWQNMDAAYRIFEEKNIPYAIGWGNHDYDNGVNNRVMYKKYFSAERLEAAGGDYWGGSLSNDTAYYLMEEKGAKLMILTIGYWSTDDDYAFAKKAIQEHSDYAVIIVTHKYIERRGNLQDADAQKMREELILPYNNVKMVLNGHDAGSNVHYEVLDEGTDRERVVWSVLTDYQREPMGGNGWMRNMHVDLENNLVYFNSYSPIIDSYAAGFDRLPVTKTPGMQKVNMEEFVIPVDFGGSSVRSLETGSLTLSCGEAAPVGEPQTIVGDQAASVEMTGLLDNTGYEWFVVLTDEAGNSLTSATMTFAVRPADKTALQSAVDAAEALDLDAYQESGKAEFTAALTEARLRLDQTYASQVDVDAAAERLRAAMDTLQLLLPEGDMDGDGVVSITDVMEACKVLARQSAGNQPTETEMQRGDLNGDDWFTIQDVMEICKILARSV